MSLPDRQTGMTAREARDLASKLADSGIPCFPVALKYDHSDGKVKKRPLTPNGHHDATTDPDVLAELFREHVKYGPGEFPGVGAYPGPAGFLVIDVDNLDALGKLEAEHGPIPGRRVRTVSGGLHIWMRLPEGVEVGQASPWAGIDIRSGRGWVVAPGTLTPWGGWVTEGGRTQTAPEWMVAAILDHEKAPRQIPPVAEPGDRHETLVSLAASMWAKGLSRSAVLYAIRGYNQEHCKPPKPDDELVDIVEWVVTKDGGPAPAITVVTSTTRRTVTQTLRELLGKTIEPTRWAIDGLLPEGLTVLGGAPKVGKSFLAVQVCLAVASGRPALGNFPTTASDVLYVAYEDGDRRLQERFRQLGSDRITDAQADRIHLEGADWPTIDGGGVGHLDRWLTDHPACRLVILDTFQRFRGRPTAGRNQYAEDYEHGAQIQAVALRHRVAVLLLHHVRQMPAEDWMDRIAGTSGITGAADTVIAIFRDRGQHDAVMHGTGRDIEDFEYAIKRNPDASWSYLGDPEVYRLSRERVDILEAMDRLGADIRNPVQVSIIADEVGKSVANVSKMLRKLQGENKVVSPKYGHYALQVGSMSLGEVVEVVEPTSTESTTSTDRHIEVPIGEAS